MRRLQDKQTSMSACISIAERIAKEHPLRAIKKLADGHLGKLSGDRSDSVGGLVGRSGEQSGAHGKVGGPRGLPQGEQKCRKL